MLDGVVSGALPPPRCVPRFALPRPSAWSYGTLRGLATVTEDETWAPGVVFGGYLGCLADQFAGLVMLTVLPDGLTFRTADLRLDLHRPVRPGEAAIIARVLRLRAGQATAHVTIAQDGAVSCQATVTQALRRHRFPGTT
jgi:uncharacterized protein (TIGR00369 family)